MKAAPTVPDDVDFSGMTKNELLSYAGENGIEGVSDRMKKADILEAILNA